MAHPRRGEGRTGRDRATRVRADGHAGSITVTRAGVQTVLSGDYHALRSDDAVTFTAPRKEVDERFGAALAAIPPRPVAFTLYFESDKDDLTEESRAKFAAIAAELTRHPAPHVTVIGHADGVGTHEYNDALSLRRAQRIAQELTRLGIAGDRVAAEGRGKRALQVPTQAAEPRNRRVEVEVR